MNIVFENLTEANPNSKNFGKPIVRDLPADVEITEQLNKIRDRASTFAGRIIAVGDNDRLVFED